MATANPELSPNAASLPVAHFPTFGGAPWASPAQPSLVKLWRDLRNWSLAIDYRETFFAGNIFENTRSTAQRAHPLVQDVSPREARQDPIAEATESASGMIFFSASFNMEFTK